MFRPVYRPAYDFFGDDVIEDLYNIFKHKEGLKPCGATFAATKVIFHNHSGQGVVSVEQHANLRRSILTPREREVIRMIAEGNSAKRIASLLGLSVKTVEAHKFNLMRKLDIHNTAQLVTYAIQKRIVALPADA